VGASPTPSPSPPPHVTSSFTVVGAGSISWNGVYDALSSNEGSDVFRQRGVSNHSLYASSGVWRLAVAGAELLYVSAAHPGAGGPPLTEWEVAQHCNATAGRNPPSCQAGAGPVGGLAPAPHLIPGEEMLLERSGSGEPRVTALKMDDDWGQQDRQEGSSGDVDYTSSRGNGIAAARAAAALDSLLETYWSERDVYLMEEVPSKVGPVRESELPYWNFQESIHAVALGVKLVDPAKYQPWVKKMVAAQEAQGGRQAGTGADGWSRDFYDDMNWATLALLAAHDVIPGDELYLVTARGVFDTIQAAWDTTACGGGVWWNAAHSQKATASNAGPALAAALLADVLEREPQPSAPTSSRSRRGGPVLPTYPNSTAYRAWAEQVFAWWNRSMTDPISGAVCDNSLSFPLFCAQNYPFTKTGSGQT
jgi:hypothetical protein